MQLLWIEFSAVTILALLLVCSWGRRQSRQRKSKSKAAWLPGHGIDAVPVKRRLTQLRMDYLAGAKQRSRRFPGQDQFASTIRRSLRRLSYFRSACVDENQDAPLEDGGNRT